MQLISLSSELFKPFKCKCKNQNIGRSGQNEGNHNIPEELTLSRYQDCNQP